MSDKMKYGSNAELEVRSGRVSDSLDELVGIEYPLSNEELAKAIDRAHNSAGQASEQQKLWFKHLETLLTIQRLRAETIFNSNGKDECLP